MSRRCRSGFRPGLWLVLLALAAAGVAPARERPSQRPPILTGAATAPAEVPSAPKRVPVIRRTFYVFTEFTAAGAARRVEDSAQPHTYALASASYRALGEDTVVDWGARGNSVARALRVALAGQRMEPVSGNRAAELSVALNWGSHRRGALHLTARGSGSRVQSVSQSSGSNPRSYSSNELPREVGSPLIPKVNGIRIDGASDVVEYRGGGGSGGGDHRYDHFSTNGVGSGFSTSFNLERGPIPKRNLLERTALFCGETVARDLEQATLLEPDSTDGRDRAQEQLRRLAAAKPGYAFLERTIDADLCYVVISAFARAPDAAGQPVLLWRTKVAVTREYRRLTDAVAEMIAVAGPYLGQSTGLGLELSRTYDRRTGALVSALEENAWDTDEATTPRTAAGAAAPEMRGVR